MDNNLKMQVFKLGLNGALCKGKAHINCQFTNLKDVDFVRVNRLMEAELESNDVLKRLTTFMTPFHFMRTNMPNTHLCLYMFYNEQDDSFNLSVTVITKEKGESVISYYLHFQAKAEIDKEFITSCISKTLYRMAMGE